MNALVNIDEALPLVAKHMPGEHYSYYRAAIKRHLHHSHTKQ